MFGRIATALLLVPFFIVSAFANSSEKGWEAYSRGDYQVALEEWWPLASSGNAAAEFNLGLMYETGKGVAQDYAVAAKWYRKAAIHGSASAQNNLGYLYVRGRGVPRDFSKAIQWYRKAADQGYALAQLGLGSFYLKGLEVPKSYSKAAQWYRKAADQGLALAQYNLGAMYLSGQGVQRSRSEAARWYRKAARQGHADAKRSLDLLTAATAKADSGAPQPLFAMNADRKAKSSDSTRSAFRVQLAAVKSDQPEVAQVMAKRLTQDHASVLDHLKVMPIRADLGERGIYYRFRVGPLTDRAAAEVLCEKLKVRQQACVVVAPKKS
jgi:TPR repeat protein